MEKNILDRFTDTYHQWTLNHKTQASVSSEYAFYLKQKDARLKEKGLQIEEDFAHVKEEIRGVIRRENFPYIASVEYREAMHTLHYLKNGKRIRRYKEPVSIYATILDRQGSSDEEIICPNCGHRSLKSELGKGCPYCGTYFELPPDYPYVTSFYSVPGITERSSLNGRIKKITIIPGVTIALLVLISYLFTSKEPLAVKIFYSIFLSAMTGGVTAFVAYMLYSFSLLSKAFFEAGRSLPLLKGIRTKKKTEEKMKAYEDDFSYEYFEGRMITLLRQIAFSKKRKALSVYTGNEDLSFFDDLVDLSYRGASQLLDLKEEDGRLQLKMRVFLNDIYYRRSIRRKDESFIVIMEKDAHVSEIGHDICRVQCRNCGGSFDALHYKDCPHCGSRYELVHDDWVISAIVPA